MLMKNKSYFIGILDDYAAKKIKEAQALQAIQNAIGEEIERMTGKKYYDVDEAEEKQTVKKGQQDIF